MSLASNFMWSGDNEETGFEWLDKVSKLGKLINNPVRTTTLLEGTKNFASFMPTSCHGAVSTISLRELSDEATVVIAKFVTSISAYVGNGFAIHLAPQPSEASLDNSVFGATESHYMLEFLATPELEDGNKESQE